VTSPTNREPLSALVSEPAGKSGSGNRVLISMAKTAYEDTGPGRIGFNFNF
jgi:hypothetical protein